MGRQPFAGFVQQQHVGGVQQGLGKRDFAFQARGKGVDRVIEDWPEFESAGRVIHPPASLRALESPNGGDELEQVLDRQGRVTDTGFGLIAYCLACVIAVCVCIQPQNPHLPRGGLDGAGDHF